ncbi:Thiol-disulfide oxidoreductase ResA [Ralstonia mannitolilytica]|uniref:TlpA family protein disulfide reductase n=1 Tax=Ralstonia mannitolilytica TaxID=105219 RepID=UPI0007B00A1C|nr:TlpA disulfide reductase family protein [Ralstonia mannitolilytica]ANA32936.1 alkyl hydroperoxide reductase [Ralstonia mannitolilytica]CAJ0692805.1 Thiol-disulfide oxidoreductase ResA [Ralstonia mannitolilytica]CAJ0871167.1 Thiol-disulfide oxidoreductase ResA [Ralstonia mannitolilytica]
MSRRTTLIALLVAGVLAAALGVYIGHRHTEPKPPANAAVATFYGTKLPDASGAILDLAAFRGQTVVINFWAPWCGPCVEEMPELSALADEQKGKVRFVGIGIDSAANIQAFLGKVHVTYPVAVAGFGGTELGRQFGNEVGGLPFTVILTPQGDVTFRKMGRVHAEELRAALQRI